MNPGDRHDKEEEWGVAERHPGRDRGNGGRYCLESTTITISPAVAHPIRHSRETEPEDPE